MKENFPSVRVRLGDKEYLLDDVMRYIKREKMHQAGKFIAEVTGIDKEYANKIAFAIRDAWEAGFDPVHLACSLQGPSKMTAKFSVKIDEEAIQEHIDELAKQEKKAQMEALDEEEKLLLRLKKVNETVDDEEVRAMLDKIEDIVTKILARVQQEPKAKALIEDFYTKYLPTAVELSEKYAQIYATGIRNEESEKLKRDMLTSLDTCDQAFHTLYEHTFDEDMIRLSSEMASLNNKLKYDGLTKSDFDISK